MDTKFFDSIFEGDSPVGVKFGMGLTGGDFWPRVAGCRNLYQGNALTADIDDIVAVVGNDNSIIGSNYDPSDNAGANHLYVLRSVNRSGDETDDLFGVISVRFDESGKVILPVHYGFVRLELTLVAQASVKLEWVYYPLRKNDRDMVFCIYSNGGSGEIDFENVIVQMNYCGGGSYVYQSENLQTGSHLFCVMARSNKGIELSLSNIVLIDVRTSDDTKILPLITEQI